MNRLVLLPTLLLCALIAAVTVASAMRLTEGFRFWTYEDLRRARAARLEVQAPPLVFRTADDQVLRPWQPGSDDGAALYLVDFIYTRCPSVCRALGSEFQQMQQELRGSGTAVRLLSISFDIDHDDQNALAAYGRIYKAEPARWSLAAPRSAADRQALLQSLGVIAIADGQGGFVHNGAIHLIDGHGRLRGLYDYEDWPQALAAAHATARPQP